MQEASNSELLINPQNPIDGAEVAPQSSAGIIASISSQAAENRVAQDKNKSHDDDQITSINEGRVMEQHQIVSTSTIKMEQFLTNLSTLRKELNEQYKFLPQNTENINYKIYEGTISKLAVLLDTLPILILEGTSLGTQISILLTDISKLLIEYNITEVDITHEKVFNHFKSKEEFLQKQVQEFTKKCNQAFNEAQKLTIVNDQMDILFKFKDVESFRFGSEQIDKIFETERKLMEREQEIEIQRGKIALLETEIQSLEKMNTYDQNQLTQLEVLKQSRTTQQKLDETEAQSASKLEKEVLAKRIQQIADSISTLEKSRMTLRFEMDRQLKNTNDSILEQYNSLVKGTTLGGVEQKTFYRIIILDDSGSMYGEPYDKSIYSIKETIRGLQQQSPEDSFCFIQFSETARVMIPKTLVKNYNVQSFPNDPKYGCEVYEAAFNKCLEVLKQCGPSERPQIIFLTDGCTGNAASYLRILQDISNQYHSQGISMFCLGYGNGIREETLRGCLKVINKDETTISLKDKKIKALFQLAKPHEILEALQYISENAQFKMYDMVARQKILENINSSHRIALNKSLEQDSELIDKQIKIQSDQMQLLKQNSSGSSANMLETIKNSYTSIFEAIEIKRNQIQNGIFSRDKEIQQIKTKKNEIESSQKKQLESLNDERKSFGVERRKKTLIQGDIQLGVELLKIGCQDEAKLDIFVDSLPTPMKIRMQIIECTQALQRYITYSHDMIEKVKIAVAKLENNTSEFRKQSSLDLIDKLKKVYLRNSDSQNPNIHKDIIYALDLSLEQDLEANGIKELFENNGFIEIMNRLSELYLLNQSKPDDEEDDEDLQTLPSFILRIQKSILGRDPDQIEIQEEIEDSNKKLRTLKKNLESEKIDKDEKKEIREEIKDLTKEIKNNKSNLKKLRKEYNKENHKVISAIKRICMLLKTAVDSLMHFYKKFRINYPLNIFMQDFKKIIHSIDKGSILTLTN